jgi:hypothetical protein
MVALTAMPHIEVALFGIIEDSGVFIAVSENGPLTSTGKTAYLPLVTGKRIIEVGVEGISGDDCEPVPTKVGPVPTEGKLVLPVITE